MTSQPKLTVVPLTPAQANLAVENIHRHHGPVPPGYALMALGCINRTTDELCGAAILGRPTNRNNDDRQTIELLRLATDGTPNAPSCLLGASRQVAKAAGAWRIITYTLDSESGDSLRAAGWVEGKGGITSWWSFGSYQGRSVVPRDHYSQTKRRWEVRFREGPVPVAASEMLVRSDDGPQGVLFPGEVSA